ncbi:hypothetical protein LUZ63_010761 [Rhynchospora breviuscula]|uniref:Uncharacterized protein n=1 Tax=Rhynchospora breviuscula TaxID=2022672 RepID=A0A9Q0HQC3_9POAL|nr:hypothetical protein LUZ63_010761 [Rhynchospora breviuscula]
MADIEEQQSSRSRNFLSLPSYIGLDELGKWALYRATITEFVATFLFLYVLVSTVIGYSHQSDIRVFPNAPLGGVGLEGVAWAIGGGHINPAVTFGLLVGGKVSLIRALFYMLAQVIGAICGAGLVKGFQKDLFNHYGGAANSIQGGYSRGTALGAEIVGTFILVYTVYSATDVKRSAHESYVPILAPLPIGFAVFVVHLATIPITGTGINPARSFGAAVVYNKDKPWDDQWIFWVGPFIGAAAAALYYEYVLSASALKALGSFRRSGSMFL